MKNDSPQAQPPEKITVLICSRCGLQNATPVCICGCAAMNRIEYVRADLPRAAADDDALQDLFNLFERDNQGRWCFKSLSRDDRKLDEVIDRLATPRATETGLRVEATLAELQEIAYEDATLECHFNTTPLKVSPGGFNISIWERNGPTDSKWRDFSDKTLEDCMNQIRAWAKSRAEREGERT